MVKTKAQQKEDVETLRQCFPRVDKNFIYEVYVNAGYDFERAYQGITSMADNKKTTEVTPQQKLSFLQAIFDKLDRNFVQRTLEQFRWSVEGFHFFASSFQ